MRTLVLGAAISGLAAARLARGAGHVVSVYDSQSDRFGDIIALGVHELVYTYIGKGMRASIDREADFADTHDSITSVIDETSASRKQG